MESFNLLELSVRSLSAQPTRRQLVRPASRQRRTAELKVFKQYDREMDKNFDFLLVVKDRKLDRVTVTYSRRILAAR